MRVHVFKIGPFENGRSYYLPIGGNRETREPTDLDPVESDDDIKALRQMVAQAKNETLVCSLELADAARSLGLAVEELPITYEGSRVRIAMDYAQGGALSKITHLRSHLRLMSAIYDFLQANVATHSFDVELRGDRNGKLAGLITTSPTTITLRRSAADAVDQLSMSLVAPPAYALAPIQSLYNVSVMPAFTKIADGQQVLPDDEDALVMAAVLASLATGEGPQFVANISVAGAPRGSG